MSSKCKLIKEQIDSLVHYLELFLPLANFHMVDYFSKDAYRRYIPGSILEEVKQLGTEDAIHCIFNDNYKRLPNLLKYVEESRKFTLKNCPNVCLKTNDFQNILAEWGCEEFLRLKLDIFMTSKKSHEVDILSFICAAVRNISGTTHVVDIGDGKGYLSSMLALHQKIPVLGVDASVINTNGAVKRVQKLSKVWNSVTNEKNRKSKETTSDLYKQVTRFVDENLDFSELVANIFLEKSSGLSLVGLHTCGNLAATSIRIFTDNEDIKTICNVGCCYHLLTESYETNSHKTICGFPMSDYLNDRKFVIGRAARMIAAQSVERILNKKDLPNKTIFYRALFEVLLEKKCPHLSTSKRHVGRFRKECTDFSEYVRKAAKRINLQVVISEEEINDLYEEYKNRVSELNIFYLIRSMLSPVIESLILLDRLLFLHERGIQKSYLVQLFDPVVSPRCYGLIALK